MNPRAIKKRAHRFDWGGMGISPRIGVLVRVPVESYDSAIDTLDVAGVDYYGSLGWLCGAPVFVDVFVWQKRIYNRPNRFLSSLSRATRSHGLRILRGRGPY